MITLIQNAETYTPDSLGRRDILIADGRIAAIETHIEPPAGLPGLEIIDAGGEKLVPGFIDAHVHICGGGGEGGFKTRTPEISLSDLIVAGITTVVGTLGTDGTTRTMENLIAKAYALDEEGVSTYTYTGSYRVPMTTLTGSLRRDIILVPKIIGAGEIAISDHRSSQPTVDELARIASDARVAGLLSGKAGVVNVHLGSGPRMLEKLERIVAETEIPITQFYPTHMNRSADLLEKARDFGRAGGYIDLTTGTPEMPASRSFRLLREAGVSADQISFTSDAQGSLPTFDDQGAFMGLEVARASSLFEAVRESITDEGINPGEALKAVTSNPARVLKLESKGRLAVGADADLLLLTEDWKLDVMMAKGRVLARGGARLVKGTFE